MKEITYGMVIIFVAFLILCVIYLILREIFEISDINVTTKRKSLKKVICIFLLILFIFSIFIAISYLIGSIIV